MLEGGFFSNFLCQKNRASFVNVPSLPERKKQAIVFSFIAHSKNPRKCAYHVTFDIDLEHTLDAR